MTVIHNVIYLKKTPQQREAFLNLANNEDLDAEGKMVNLKINLILC